MAADVHRRRPAGEIGPGDRDNGAGRSGGWFEAGERRAPVDGVDSQVRLHDARAERPFALREHVDERHLVDGRQPQVLVERRPHLAQLFDVGGVQRHLDLRVDERCLERRLRHDRMLVQHAHRFTHDGVRVGVAGLGIELRERREQVEQVEGQRRVQQDVRGSRLGLEVAVGEMGIGGDAIEKQVDALLVRARLDGRQQGHLRRR
ncbi:hypothetical protein D3C83_07980 [compost metagenome]